MDSNLLLTVLLVLLSLSLTSGYSLSTRDALFKQDDESYFMATNDQGSSMIDVEDLGNARSLQALVAGSKVVVNKVSKSKKGSKKKKNKSNKGGSLNVAAHVGITIAAIVVTIVIICVIYYFYLRHKTKKALSVGQVSRAKPDDLKCIINNQKNVNGSSETQTSKTKDTV